MVSLGNLCQLVLGEFSSRTESVIVVVDSMDSESKESLVPWLGWDALKLYFPVADEMSSAYVFLNLDKPLLYPHLKE